MSTPDGSARVFACEVARPMFTSATFIFAIVGRTHGQRITGRARETPTMLFVVS